eukprot:TRINITY_DN1015_c0_g1_i2.p1 TRINITY_DN1015_c0_g1~~TRINITY_DN1015_c0_g1_i2.p1  ORF type:complete len:268 (-),score=86.97 TRINITY_DN1015_c0_g1_i2:206-1009(-)
MVRSKSKKVTKIEDNDLLEQLESLRAVDLREQCKARELSTSGRKVEMIERLRDFIENGPSKNGDEEQEHDEEPAAEDSKASEETAADAAPVEDAPAPADGPAEEQPAADNEVPTEPDAVSNDKQDEIVPEEPDHQAASAGPADNAVEDSSAQEPVAEAPKTHQEGSSLSVTAPAEMDTSVEGNGLSLFAATPAEGVTAEASDLKMEVTTEDVAASTEDKNSRKRPAPEPSTSAEEQEQEPAEESALKKQKIDHEGETPLAADNNIVA